MKTRRFAVCVWAAALALGAPVTLHAADEAKPSTPIERPSRPGRGEASANVDPTARLKAVIDDLKLTGDKKTKTDAILAKAKESADKAIKDAAGDRRAGFAQAAQVVRAAGEEISALLDEDQKLMFQSKMQAAARAGAGGAGGGAAPGGGGGPGARPMQVGQRIKDATATLGLSDEQSKKVDAAIAGLQKKAEEIRATGPGPDMREKIMALREEGLTKMKAILSEDQFKKFETAMQQQPQGGPSGGRLGGAIQRFQDAMKDLNLTDEQKPKVEAALAEARKKFAELAPSLQGGQPSPEAREKIRTAMEELRTELMAALTPEQQEKLRAAMQQGSGAGARPRPGTGAAKPDDK